MISIRAAVHRIGMLVLLSAFFTLVPASQGQLCESNCVSRCRGTWGYGNNNSISYTSCVTNCQSACREQQKPPEPAPFGAIAFAPDGSGGQGISWHFTTQAAADRKAMSYCTGRSSNCRIVYRFQNTCAALAMNAAKTQFEVVTADNDRTAEDRAIAACEGKWGKCTTDMSGCSFSDGHHPPPAPRTIAWAAIAYSAPDMKEGHAQGKRDRASAEQEAMAMCQQHGRQCAIRATFNKQCGALAADGTVTGVGVAADQRASLQKALEDCRRAGGARCAPHVAFCSH